MTMSNVNTVQATGSKGRQDLLKFDPEDLVLVEDEKHALYDPRVKMPLDEALVRNIMANGIIQPITARRNGERDGKALVEVVTGRQRVRAAREANKRLAAEGAEPVLVPTVLKRGDDRSLFGVIVSENELRRGDSTTEKAKKLQRYIDMGGDEDQAAVQFGVSRSTIRNYLALLDCDKAVQKAVDAGSITATLAITEFSKVPREEQRAALEKVLSNGAAKGRNAKDNVRAARNGGAHVEAAPRMPSRQRLERSAGLLKYGQDGYQDGFRAAIDWVLGNKPRGWKDVKLQLEEGGVLPKE
jgi:ParB family chromosome partitioning protein